ncbi:MAG TPA: TonB-dependent receptor [Blastocatellia bacterium]|nr:TonB-dependent receptor [Blastocatellia bacterium]
MRRLRRAKALASSLTAIMIAALMVPMFSQPVLAQTTTGSIRGVVTDQTGAVVSGANVTAKNQSTGVETGIFKTTGEGIYNIPNLIPGTYTITVEAPNFKRAAYTDVEVRLGEVATIDAILQPGGVTETITVTAGSEEVVNRETAQVSTSFESRKVAELPSNVAGTGIDTLALLAPGVVPGFGNVNSNGTTLSVNGQRSRSNNFTIDGQDNNDLSIGGPVYFVSNQDLVQDFQVITNNFSAQYGRNQGAIVNIVTKAGTNEFHGSAFWYHLDRKLFGTLNNIERRGGKEEADPLLYNVFGGTLGGPILKDRAFFFGSYQGIRTRETFIARSGNLAILPEDLARLKADFPGNNAIAALADFSAFAIQDFGTVRPRTDLADPFDTITIGGQTYRAAFPERVFKTALATPTTQEEFTGRGDIKLTDRDNIFARYLFQDSNIENALGLSNGFTGDLPARSQNFGSGWTRQISSRAVNEFRFAYSRLFVNFGGGCEGLKGCIPDPELNDTAFADISFGGIRGAATGAALQTIGGGAGLPQGRTVETFQFSDNFSLTRGRHQMVMGADVRRLDNFVPLLFNVNGVFAFGTAARLAQNNPSSVTLAAGQTSITYKETDQFYFFQDDWKVRDNLTLNLGLRYEYIGQPINTLHEITLERESNPQTALFKTSLPVEARIVPKLRADKNNFAPRLGFAYSPRFSGDGWLSRLFGEDATVLRGGYSIAYDPPFYNILINISTNAPVVFSNLTLNPAAAPIFPVPSPAPFGPDVRAFAEANGIIQRGVQDPRFNNQVPVAPDFHLPYAQQWSFGIQRQINRNNVFEVRYIGTHAVGLFQTVNRNPRVDRLLNGFTTPEAIYGQAITFPGFPNLLPQGLTPFRAGVAPCVDDPATTTFNEANQCNGRILLGGRIQARENTARSLYHGLQSRYNGRLFNQFTLGASYTFSKALDNISEIFAFAENSLAQNPFNINEAERSWSAFDRPHAFSANGIWDLPGFKDQQGLVGKVLGGWQLNGTYVLTSGRRYTPSQFFNNPLAVNFGVSYLDQLFGDIFRPFFGNPGAPRTQVGLTQLDAFLLAPFFGIDVPGTSPNLLYSFNEFNRGNLVTVSPNDVRYIFNGPGAAVRFGTPFGNVPRNYEKGPRLNQLNLGIFKNTRINERVTVQFRTELFNALNHPNPGYGLLGAEAVTFPDNFVEDAGVEGTAFGDFTDMTLSRRLIQFGLRIIF